MTRSASRRPTLGGAGRRPGLSIHLSMQLSRRSSCQGPESRLYRFDRRLRPSNVRLERLAHRAEMFRRCSAASTDDPRPGVERKPGVVSHELWCSIETDCPVDILRNPTVCLRDEDR